MTSLLINELSMLPAIAVHTELGVNGRIYPAIEAGEGPLVVCLHGFPDNNESFQTNSSPSSRRATGSFAP